ncbi:MAG: hypothetical protein RJQ14_01525, partial [Marinoscillum sp.]
SDLSIKPPFTKRIANIEDHLILKNVKLVIIKAYSLLRICVTWKMCYKKGNNVIRYCSKNGTIELQVRFSIQWHSEHQAYETTRNYRFSPQLN